MTGALKIIAAASWLTLIVCFLAFCYIGVNAANTVLVTGPKDRDDMIRDIQASKDARYLQMRGTTLVQGSEFTSWLSMFLCRVAVVAFLISMICSGVTLFQARRLRRLMDQARPETH